ncbi:hypothetical protein DQ04_22311000, partial [Trypanosoma grayi]|uniref:hypothetical protein n=1 Tax=Trypanosoma grayi TaxID=71804 RepID=UPI0004F4A06C
MGGCNSHSKQQKGDVPLDPHQRVPLAAAASASLAAAAAAAAGSTPSTAGATPEGSAASNSSHDGKANGSFSPPQRRPAFTIYMEVEDIDVDSGGFTANVPTDGSMYALTPVVPVAPFVARDSRRLAASIFQERYGKPDDSDDDGAGKADAKKPDSGGGGNGNGVTSVDATAPTSTTTAVARVAEKEIVSKPPEAHSEPSTSTIECQSPDFTMSTTLRPQTARPQPYSDKPHGGCDEEGQKQEEEEEEEEKEEEEENGNVEDFTKTSKAVRRGFFGFRLTDSKKGSSSKEANASKKKNREKKKKKEKEKEKEKE